MKLKITDKEIDRLCKLSMLEVKSGEREKTLKELNGMVELLTELDGVTAIEKSADDKIARLADLRSDEACAPIKRDELLYVTPKTDGDSFIVKRVVE
jgi:aspartyl/glutamyl-tRNA(Asn/Gln) amidotransferase C subunit